MQSIFKCASQSCHGDNVRIKQIDKYSNLKLSSYFLNNTKSLITRKFSNQNNSKISNQHIISPTNKIKENVIKIKKLKDPFNKYIKILNRLNFDKPNQLKSVSCQSENLTIIKPRENRQHIINSISNIKYERSFKTMDPLIGYKVIKTHRNDESLKDINRYYDNVQCLIKNRNIPFSNSVIDDQKTLLDLELLIKSLVNKFNASQTRNDLYILDQKRDKGNYKKLLMRTCISKSIQCKANTHSKAVNINQQTLMTPYNSILVNLIMKTINFELLKCIIYHFVEHLDTKLFLGRNNINHPQIKMEGDELISNKNKILNNTFERVKNLPSKSLDEMICINDSFPNNGSNKMVGVVNVKPKNSNRISRHFVKDSDKIQINDIEYYLTTRKPLKHSRLRFKSKCTDKFSVSCGENSLQEVDLSLGEVEDETKKYRKNCSSKQNSEIRHVTLRKYQPFIQKEVTQEYFRLNISGSGLNIDNNLQNFQKSNECPNESCEILTKPITSNQNLCTEMIETNLSQSDTDKEQFNDVMFQSTNRNQSQYVKERFHLNSKNPKRSAKITLINPFSKYSNAKILGKCQEILKEKCIPECIWFNWADDIIKNIYLKIKSTRELTQCSELHLMEFILECKILSIVVSECDKALALKTVSNTQEISYHLDEKQKYFANKQQINVNNSPEKGKILNLQISGELNIFSCPKTINISKTFSKSIQKLQESTCNTRLKNSQALVDKVPFPNKYGFESFYRTIFQSWVFQ